MERSEGNLEGGRGRTNVKETFSEIRNELGKEKGIIEKMQ